ALARQAGAFARYRDPQQLLDAEYATLGQMGAILRAAGHGNLAEFVALRPQRGEPLLSLAARYFFRRAVEEDSALFQGLAFAQLEQLQQAQETGFAGLTTFLREQGDRLEELLGDVKQIAVEVREVALDVRAEQRRQGEQAQQI